MSSAGRTVVIGDIHGCLEEVHDLLRAVGATRQDRLISVGDLIGKGPDSAGVADWAMGTANLECVLGNHELRYIRAFESGGKPSGKPYDAETLRQLDYRYGPFCAWLRRLPLTIDTGGWMVVHAGLDPRRPLAAQKPEDLTGVRRLDDLTPWYERYADPRLIVFGHWVRREPLVRQNAIGLDTGCVYGGKLTALILPERRLVSVKARREYAARKTWQ